MPSTGILEDSITEYIVIIRDFIDNKKYWTTFNYNYVYDRLKQLSKIIRNTYHKTSLISLEEANRQILENTFYADFDVYISYYNALLYIRKLERKVRWHQKYGRFPE